MAWGMLGVVLTALTGLLLKGLWSYAVLWHWHRVLPWDYGARQGVAAEEARRLAYASECGRSAAAARNAPAPRLEIDVEFGEREGGRDDEERGRGTWGPGG